MWVEEGRDGKRNSAKTVKEDVWKRKGRDDKRETRQAKRRNSTYKHSLVNLMTDRMTIMRWDGTRIIT